MPRRKAETSKNGDTNRAEKRSATLLRDKDRTKALIISAVGKVLMKKGYPGLNPVNLAAEAGVDKRLISYHFKSMENVVELYILTRDVWQSDTKEIIESVLSNPENAGKDEAYELLRSLFDNFQKDKVAQKIIHWEIGEKSKLLRKIADDREEMGEQLLKMVDPYFENSGVDIRATLALLIGGIYYLTLHSESNGSKFCGIDIKQAEGKQRILDTIKRMINNDFESIKPQK